MTFLNLSTVLLLSYTEASSLQPAGLQGSYGSWKTWKVMEFRISFSRPGKSWNLSVGDGKSWKMTFIVQNKLGSLFFVNEKAKIFWNCENFRKQLVNFRSWKVMEFQKLKRVRNLGLGTFVQQWSLMGWNLNILNLYYINHLFIAEARKRNIYIRFHVMSLPALPISTDRKSIIKGEKRPHTFAHFVNFPKYGSAIFDNHTVLLFWLQINLSHVLSFVLCSLDVLRTQRIMGFFL